MFPETGLFLASFTVPEQIGLNPNSMLWLLPLVASIAIVYKALKVKKIQFGIFLKEVAVLFGSIVIFISITALVLFALSWWLTE
ncbi:MAG: hypothetical protein ACYTFM_01570 [Planctomycetota bacterium]|jgi:hypothetical protein